MSLLSKSSDPRLREDLMAIVKGRGRTSQLFRVWAVLGAAVLAAILLILVRSYSANAAPTLPSGFQETVAFGGLTNPTTVQFSKDGRVFVAEKSGLIKIFDNLSDTTPTTFADLRTNVHNFWDRGMLGMILDPNFPTDPYVYVLYTHDAAIGGTAPRWGQPGVTSDDCPTPPGATEDGCVVSGRLSRLKAHVNNNTMSGPDAGLESRTRASSSSPTRLGAWHSALMVRSTSVAGTERAPAPSPTTASPHPRLPPLNTRVGPSRGGRGTLTPPTAEGGALRSQDLRTSGDPVTLDGTVLRVDPATGNALPTTRLSPTPIPTPGASSPTGCATPFARPSWRGRAPTRYGWAMSARIRGRG